MQIKLKQIAVLEFIIIILLVLFLIYSQTKSAPVQDANAKELLSPRVYAELLEPKSFLIVKFTPLQQRIQSYVEKNNLNISVYIKNLRNGASMGINSDAGFIPASLTKVPLAILVMEKIENGDLTLGTKLPILYSDRASNSGSLYKTDRKEATVGLLLSELLKESDNTAFNVLSHQIESKNLDLLMDYFDIDVYNQNYNVKSSQKRGILVSPRKMGNIFSSLYFSTLLEPKDSEYLLNLMIDTLFDIEKATNLPKDIIVSQKYGSYYTNNTRLFHSCGILYIHQSRIFYCVMTKDINESEAARTTGFIVNETYHYVLEERAKLDVYKQEGTFK